MIELQLVNFSLYLSNSFPHISHIILLLNGEILGGGGGYPGVTPLCILAVCA